MGVKKRILLFQLYSVKCFSEKHFIAPNVSRKMIVAGGGSCVIIEKNTYKRKHYGTSRSRKTV